MLQHLSSNDGRGEGNSMRREGVRDMVSNERVRSKWYQAMFVSIALVMLLAFALVAMPPRGLYGFQFQVIRDGQTLKIIIRNGPEPLKRKALVVNTGIWLFRRAAAGIYSLAVIWPMKGRELMRQALNNTLGKGINLVKGSAHSVAYRLSGIVRRR